jgi:hypothetical protein
MDFTFIIIHICINLFTNIRAPKNKNILQLYHDDNKFILNEIMMTSALY